jgi:cobalt/nickel transport system permease protein
MSLALEPPPIVDSPIARLDPRWKLAALAFAAAAAAALRSPGPALTTFGATLFLAGVARLPIAWILRRLGTLAIALAPFAIIMPLIEGWAGVRLTGLFAAKAGAIVTLALVAIGTTPAPVALHAAGAMRLPGTLIHVLLLSYRYLFVLSDEMDRLRRAVRVRGFRARMNRHTYRTIGHVIGTLVVHGTERAEGVAHAMRCRGFDGHFRSLAMFRTTLTDVAFFSTMVLAAAGVLMMDAR